ncbi:aminotransferase class I/II-fold pyridoxal phosphate-dependent enzyme [Pseudodesulfovibrio sp. F-1]|uniref:Aminotransferase class I/II-fold pyridoxal phosphate-dependent enzyme n=1 Tax=Pseudodesulfovibrio alkaliphilus TaxID=2661613 RepID=A0A7K1KN81_9BACT|nr:DegT/DnrJ/EryC1/StrS family aminotransferase [Pseudodesulfovibrio alkaliphilus]MUM77535.1 aminotransferase class I/II-fold pyridoxal phosphate-dependent enzyme [Pseudodesulfovibrio alkaliphilus]
MYRIPLSKPFMTEDIMDRVRAVLKSGFLTEGPVTREFEQAVAEKVGATHCVAATSCTTGLEMALRALGIGLGDEVIVPDYTYPATAMVVNIIGAECVVVDVDPRTMLIDYDALKAEISPKTRAVIPVSLFGNPLDWDRLREIRERTDIFIVEDAACALGSSHRGAMTGSLADISVFSHHPRKFITTGEGGTVTTNNAEWAEWMVSYKHFGLRRADSRLSCEFYRIGTNYKLSDVLAGIGVAQIRHMEGLLTERRGLAAFYRAFFADDERIGLPEITQNGEHSWQTCCVFVKERDRVMEAMRSRGIEVQIGTYALHMHPAFANNPACRFASAMEGSRYAFEHSLALPLYPGMTEAEQTEVGETLKEVLP